MNENDTVSVSELRFGDNDTLSAITAGLVDADYLFLCTDVDGLYTGNPRSDPTARRLGVVGSVLSARKAGEYISRTLLGTRRRKIWMGMNLSEEGLRSAEEVVDCPQLVFDTFRPLSQTHLCSHVPPR